ncbi:MAG: hypothetical protein LBP20_10715 [Treponema sp.]|nr:hypothetical protein [Treponema sp.]
MTAPSSRVRVSPDTSATAAASAPSRVIAAPAPMDRIPGYGDKRDLTGITSFFYRVLDS